MPLALHTWTNFPLVHFCFRFLVRGPLIASPMYSVTVGPECDSSSVSLPFPPPFIVLPGECLLLCLLATPVPLKAGPDEMPEGASRRPKLFAAWPRCRALRWKMCFSGEAYVVYPRMKDWYAAWSNEWKAERKEGERKSRIRDGVKRWMAGWQQIYVKVNGSNQKDLGITHCFRWKSTTHTAWEVVVHGVAPVLKCFSCLR